jgi:hypothetical protein
MSDLLHTHGAPVEETFGALAGSLLRGGGEPVNREGDSACGSKPTRTATPQSMSRQLTDHPGRQDSEQHLSRTRLSCS